MLSISMELMINIYFADSISQAFYSPLSSERGWGRGFAILISPWRGVGGEAVSLSTFFLIFNTFRPHQIEIKTCFPCLHEVISPLVRSHFIASISSSASFQPAISVTLPCCLTEMIPRYDSKHTVT